MIGNNKLILNEATMIEAVQTWLRLNFVGHCPKVKSINSEDRISNTFVVALDSEETSPNQEGEGECESSNT